MSCRHLHVRSRVPDIGARPIFAGDVSEAVITDGRVWDEVAIVEYPCRAAFFRLLARPDFRARVVDKDAGVAESISLVSTLRSGSLPEGVEPNVSPHPPTEADPSFEMIHVMKFHDVAQYDATENEPMRSGEDAVGLYSSAATSAAAKLGVYPTAWFDVEGALLGDERQWDQVRLNHMPSRAAFEALVADPMRAGAQFHRDAGLLDSYSLITVPQLNEVPGAPMDPNPGSGGTAPAVDGTGTACTEDSDCEALQAKTCLDPNGLGGL